MQFYNQNYSSNKKAKNGNDEFGFNTGGGESRDGITSKGGQPTKAESAIYALLHGK
jgi:hypothetical protein